MAKKTLSAAEVAKARDMYKNGASMQIIEEVFNISYKTAMETVYNFTEKELYKLYYEGLTPKFIALKFGVIESDINYWIYLKNAAEYAKADNVDEFYGRNFNYAWKKQRDNILAKGKKCCKTKEEQEAKCYRTFGNEIETALAKEEMLNPEIITRVSEKLGYKTVSGFRRAVKLTGLMTEELEGIFAKM